MKALIFLFLSPLVFASPKAFDLQMEISVEGKHVSSPRTIVREGQTATVTTETKNGFTYIEVTAREGIMMDFTMGTISKNGVKKALNKGKMLVKENHKGKMMKHDDKGKELFSFTVTPKTLDL